MTTPPITPDELLKLHDRVIMTVPGSICQEIYEALRSAAAQLTAANAREAATGRVAVRDVIAERERQECKEGWTVAHDDEHTDGSLAQAAACYALAYQDFVDCNFVANPEDENDFKIPALWPKSWAGRWWKPKDRRRDLVRAAALIIAEIERLDRKAALDAGGGAT